MTKTNEYMQESLENQASASKDYFISSAKICDGKSPKDFSIWQGDVNRYTRYTHKDPNDIALMTSHGSLYTYVKELTFSGKNWPDIKPFLQSRFSECGNPILAKYRSNLLKQGDRPCMIIMVNMQGYWNMHTIFNQLIQLLSHLFPVKFSKLQTHIRSKLRRHISRHFHTSSRGGSKTESQSFEL